MCEVKLEAVVGRPIPRKGPESPARFEVFLASLHIETAHLQAPILDFTIDSELPRAADL